MVPLLPPHILSVERGQAACLSCRDSVLWEVPYESKRRGSPAQIDCNRATCNFTNHPSPSAPRATLRHTYTTLHPLAHHLAALSGGCRALQAVVAGGGAPNGAAYASCSGEAHSATWPQQSGLLRAQPYSNHCSRQRRGAAVGSGAGPRTCHASADAAPLLPPPVRRRRGAAATTGQSAMSVGLSADDAKVQTKARPHTTAP